MTDCVIPISAQADLFHSTFPTYVDISDRLTDFVDTLSPAEVEPSEIVPTTTLVGRSQVRHGDAADILPTIEGESVGLVVTSPPYNIGKSYEKRTSLVQYIEFQRAIIQECHRVLRPDGAMCWQVGNYVGGGEVLPIDSIIIPIFREMGMKVRNRIVWTFGHGLHCKNRLSGRHETIVWATKSDEYRFDLDPIRVPQKYPQKKHYKGPKKGELSGNPKGKNPGDVWDDISNVKHNHPEKLDHPCQFPEALINRLVLGLTAPGDCVLDPFAGTGTVGAVCNRLGRPSILIEREERYAKMAARRLSDGLLSNQ
ncbi:site-specific DNA-methyltransferase [Sinorhizobium sp. GL28]|uniref:DNA-methyltransferase n=1 Tax=Sinorhizobium sp. GL28 TaxID=1358418 RepID=UPI0007278B88|nr:site-specific DNA-methyltransferase [Sinorhizobium sp. GL28]KSV87546.1 DNA methyltransferase [Sinorhizobium sp. GL28]